MNRQHLAALDYLLNEHPNRASVIGDAMQLDLSDSVRQQIKSAGNASYKQRILQETLNSMGYDDLETCSNDFGSTNLTLNADK